MISSGLPSPARWHRWVFAAALPFGAIAWWSLLAGSTWLGEVCRHFSHLAVIALVVAAPLCWPLRKRTATLAITALAGCWPWVLSGFSERAPHTSHGVAVVSANLFDFNLRRSETIAAVVNTGADLVALQEVALSDRSALEPHWPYRVWTPYGKLLPTGLLSRFPITRSSITDLGGFAMIDAEVTLPDGNLRVLVVHLWSPKSPARIVDREQQLRQLTAYANERSGKLLVLGDFNCSLVATALAPLADLRLRPPPGFQPATWPAWLGPFGTDLDHIFGRGVAMSAPRALILPGSDHRGVQVLVALGSPAR